MSLLEVLRKNEFNGFPLRTAKHFIRQILQSMSYLHSMDIIHTDIKPDNILLSHGAKIESMLTAQLKAQARAAEIELQKEIDAGFDPLNTAGKIKTWHDYFKKIPGATLEQEEMIAKKRFEVEGRKWPIIKSTPVESEIDFMVGTKIQYRSSAGSNEKDRESPPSQTQNLGDTVKKAKPTSTKQRSSPSHPSKPKVTTSNLTATAHQNTTSSAVSPITLPPSAPLPVPIPFNFYSENADTPDKPSQPTVWDQAIADSGYSGSTSGGNRVLPLSPAEMASSIGLRNGGYSTGFKAPLLYSGLPSRNSSASPTTRLQKDFENISMGLASYQQEEDWDNGNNNPNDDFGVDMLEMRSRRPLTRNGSQRSIAGSISSSSSSSSNLASGGTGGSSLFTTRTGGTTTTASGGAGAAYNYGYGTPTLTSSPEIGFARSPTTTALGISGLKRTRRGSNRNNPPLALPFSQQYAQATLYNNSTGFSCPSPETALSGLPINQHQQQNYAMSPRQHQGGSSTASPLSHLSNYFISPTSLALNGQRAFPYTSLSGSPAQSFMPTTASLGLSAELASTSFGDRHGQRLIGGLTLAQHLHGNGSANSTAVKPFSTPPPKRADTSSASLQDETSTSGSTPTCGTPEKHETSASPQKTLPDLTHAKIKLADLGNAIFFGEMKGRNALPEFVCTRQYRPPENLIGAPYDQGIDVWATACVVFEMLTGDLLFNPGSKRFKWSKEDDLLAQQIELREYLQVDLCAQ
jgi:serine/threonine protein kinase